VAGLAGAALVVLGAYSLARAIFVTNARGLDRRLDALADGLEAIVEQATAGRSLPSTAL
jgi:Flp pilus assembly protein TadB